LIRGRGALLWRRDPEPDPAEIPLSFKPVIAEKVVERALDKSACVLCDRRISYKKDQFNTVGPQQPYLFLVHNPFIGPKSAFYHNPAENALFEKMIEAVLGLHPREMLVREILRCHFSAEDVLQSEYIENCSKHLRAELAAHNIKGILLFGQAATLVFKDKQQLKARENLIFEWQGIPTMVCPGPNRLVYMREKNFDREQIDAERQNIFSILSKFRSEVMV
jgi:hypothetical protein